MVDATDLGDRIETRDDLGDDDAGLYSYWMGQDTIAEREERDWVKRARKIIKRYRDERVQAENNTHRLNILWSNVQTLLPTLYARTPKADVQRRFKDDDDSQVSLLAAQLLERCLDYSLDAQDFDSVMEAVVQDRLLPGRGVARILYVPHFGDEIRQPQLESDEGTGEQVDAFQESEEQGVVITNPGDENEDDDPNHANSDREVVFEEAIVDYVYWEDYREGPARQGREVPWIRFQSYLTRDQLIDRFGKDKGNKVELDYTPRGVPETTKDEPPADLYKKARVYEIWDKDRLEVVWLAPNTPDVILDRRDDPLRLPDFFPRPDPLFATLTNDKRIPVPDYVEYQDQAHEIDKLTARIDVLTRALKVSGVYAGDNKEVLQQLIDEGTENKLIPVGDAQAWADKGGMKGIIEWMPIQQVAETLIQLHNARDKSKALLYEITGIGDIMRGMTDPDETAAAQKLKSNFATRRVSPQQKKVAKFAKNAIRLMAAVICEHFSNKTISLITGYPQLKPVPQLPPRPAPPPPQLVSPVPAPAAAPAGPNASGGAGTAVPGAAQPPPPSPQMQAYQQQMAQWQQMAQAVQAIQAKNQQNQQDFEQAVEVIRRDGVHGFRIDIEADSTIAIDEMEDQANRTEFMQQFIPMLEQVVPLAMGNPPLASLAKEMTLFAMRGFKVARPLEEAVTKGFDAIAQMPKPQEPDKAGGVDSPADLAVRSKQVDAQNAKTQVQLQLGQQKNALEAAKIAQDAQQGAAKLAAEEASNRAKHMLEIGKAADQANFRRTRAASIEAKEASSLT